MAPSQRLLIVASFIPSHLQRRAWDSKNKTLDGSYWLTIFLAHSDTRFPIRIRATSESIDWRRSTTMKMRVAPTIWKSRLSCLPVGKVGKGRRLDLPKQTSEKRDIEHENVRRSQVHLDIFKTSPQMRRVAVEQYSLAMIDVCCVPGRSSSSIGVCSSLGGHDPLFPILHLSSWFIKWINVTIKKQKRFAVLVLIHR